MSSFSSFTPNPALSSPRRQSGRAIDTEYQSSNSFLNRIKQDNRQIPIPGVQVLEERRRSLLGPRDNPKRLSKHANSNSTKLTTSLSSTNYVKDEKPLPTQVPARHSIAVIPMAYKKASQNTTAQVQGPPQLHLSTDMIAPDDQSSICHSPTWGEEKSKKKNSAWGWRKSSYSKARKEEDMEQSIKQGKKLNKKPPPAMETQRQSATLANGTALSESAQMERRPSSSGSLTQAMRGFLSRRSSQTTSPEVSRPGSVLALRSQSQEPKVREISRKSSAEVIRYDEDDTYANEMAEFGAQMESSARAALTESKSHSFAPSQSTTYPAPPTPPHSRGQEENTPPAIPESQAHTKPDVGGRSTSVPASISRIFGKKDNAAGGYKYPNMNNKNVDGSALQVSKGTWLNRSFGSTTTTKSEPQVGAGYVQRQRMVQQQRSIARFQDELAVKSAYDQFITDSQLPPTPQDSTDSVQSGPEAANKATKQQSKPNGVPETRANMGSPKSGPPSWAATPPPKPTNQVPYHFPPSPERKSIHQAGIPSPEKKSFLQFRSSQEKTRPAPAVIQPKMAERNNSLPVTSYQPRTQSDEVPRQSKESSATFASTASSASTSTLPTQKLSPVYQLPPIGSSQTSPLFPSFADQSSDGNSPPTLNLNDNTIRLIPSVPRKDEPLPPLPPNVTPVLMNKNELLVASENAEGILRKTSIKKHRSDPELKIPELKVEQAKTDLPSLDFLPELKHQPLVKPKRMSRVTFAPGSPNQAPISPSQFPLPSPPTDVARRNGGQMRASKRTSVAGAGALLSSGSMPPKPIAKLFVICCKCKFWHDLPSKLYEAMALPQAVSKEDDIAGGINQKASNGRGILSDGEVKGLEGRIFTQVACPWCEHGMSTSCCAGWTAITYLHERHH